MDAKLAAVDAAAGRGAKPAAATGVGQIVLCHLLPAPVGVPLFSATVEIAETATHSDRVLASASI